MAGRESLSLIRRSKSAPSIIICLILMIATRRVEGQNGTTPGIQAIFIERCDNFQQMNPEQFVNNTKNCSSLWEVFLGSFAEKSPCNVTVESYSEFMLKANHTSSVKDKAMFWSLVSPFVYNYTASESGRFHTILDFLSAYVLNGLAWCWSLSKNDLDYDSCPPYQDCPNQDEAVRSFWKANSRHLARLASGRIYAMLNGSTNSTILGAYTNRSLFYTDEVPNMESPRITTMNIIVVHNPGQSYGEYCEHGTLVELSNQLRAKNITHECEDDPPDVRRLQCKLYPVYTQYCSSSGVSSIPDILWSMCCSTVALLLITKLYFTQDMM